jgi:hypothetical protein
MTTHCFSGVLRLAAGALLVLPLAACGGGAPSGLYVAKGQAIFDKFDFQSGNKVAVTQFGQTVGAEYTKMDDGRVRVMINGSVVTLKKADDGCLVIAAGDEDEAKTAAQWGGDPSELGRFCKE